MTKMTHKERNNHILAVILAVVKSFCPDNSLDKLRLLSRLSKSGSDGASCECDEPGGSINTVALL